MLEGRDPNGKFVKGEWKGGPGRPPKSREEAYRRVCTETISLEKFKASCFKMWLDSIGQTAGKDGKLVDDPQSTPVTRINAFGKLAAYAMGRPIQPLLIDSAQGDILAIFREMNSEKFDQIISEAQRLLARPERNGQDGP